MTSATTLVGGRVIDGSGAPARRANVVIADGVVTAVDPSAVEGKRIEVDGCVVTPGFIDIHSHADWLLGWERGHQLLSASVEQGITTAIVGNCGISPAPLYGNLSRLERMPLCGEVATALPWSWTSFADYLEWVSQQGLPLNCGFLVGHSTLRCATVDSLEAPATTTEVIQMAALLEEALSSGALGLSAGLEYFPGRYAPSSEIERLARVVASRDAVLATHTRGISATYSDGMHEVLQIAASSGCRLQISHVNPMGQANWQKFDELQSAVDAASANGADVGFDAVAYIAWSAPAADLLPQAFLGDLDREAIVAMARTEDGRRILAESAMSLLPRWPTWPRGSVTRNQFADLGWDNIVIADAGAPRFSEDSGSSIGYLARREGRDPFEVYFDWVAESGGAGRALLPGYSGTLDDEAVLEKILSDPRAIPETDTAHSVGPSGQVELTLPLFFGTMPRFLGHFARDRGITSLEAAVRRVTSLPAERVGLHDRGRLREGFAADVVVFDPDQIGDAGTYLSPDRPTGIAHVLVNGEPIYDGVSTDLDRLPGRVLRANPAHGDGR